MTASAHTNPAPQVVDVSGIDAHGAMGDGLLPLSMPPDQILRGGAQDAGFQSFVYTLTKTPGPATYHGTIEAVFRHIDATCWADLQKPAQGCAFQTLLKDYADILDAS